MLTCSLRAAEALSTTGRRTEAGAQLEWALVFYRSVGVARYIRESEAVPAASA